MSNSNYTHLTEDNRYEIMECLDRNVSFKDITRRINKSPTAISREVKKRMEIQPLSVKLCKSDGTPIEDKICTLLLKAPFVCNPCKKRRGNCGYRKQIYQAKNAHKHYETLLVESREGIPLNKEAFWESDAIIAENTNKGQRHYHILQSNDIAFPLPALIDTCTEGTCLFRKLTSQERSSSRLASKVSPTP